MLSSLASFSLYFCFVGHYVPFEMRKIPVHSYRRWKRDESDDDDSDEGNKNTTPQITVRVTSTATVNKEDSTTAISVVSPSVLTNKANKEDVDVAVILVPVLFSLLLLAVFILCLIYKIRINAIWKQTMLQNGRKFKSNTDDITKENIRVCVHNSGYDKEVVLSSLPLEVPTKQTPVISDNNYSVLNRENDTKNYRAKNHSITSEYDLLNQSKRATSVENYSGNFYNTADPVLNTGDQECAYDKANEVDKMYMYTRVGQSKFNSAANQDIYSRMNQENDDYSMTTQGIDKSNEDQTSYYSSANHSTIYSTANQRNVYSSVGQRQNDYSVATQETIVKREDNAKY